jgi:hypothetical protein
MRDGRPLVTRKAREGGALDQVRLVVAGTSSDVDRIRAFRAETYLERSSLVIDDDRAVDARGRLFGLSRHGTLVGCARVLSRPDPDAGIARFEHHPALRRHARVPEVGRLAVARDGSPLLLLAILGLGARWMVEHTDERSFVAYCRPWLVKAYEQVGARDLGVELDDPATGRPYRLVLGRFDTAAEHALGLLARFGPAGSDLPRAVGPVSDRERAA